MPAPCLDLTCPVLVTVPRSRFPMRNSPVRGRRWYRFCLHGELNGAKVVSVGVHGDGDGMHAPIPAPRGDLTLKTHILARSNNCDI